MLEVTTKKAKPFMKWAGGKGKLLPQLQPFFPRQFNNYFEPFFGGGAVFFNLDHVGKAYINDINDTLMDAYTHLKNDLQQVIDALFMIEKQYRELNEQEQQDFYYEQRAKFNTLSAGIKKTVLLIFLNKTCFNGLYRENRKGEFNVPFGRYVNPTICDRLNLQAVSSVLQNTIIHTGSYKDVLQYAKEGDFVYFDPPYMPLNSTSSFTAYHEDGFGVQDQINLKNQFAELDKRGCFVMLSNSSAEFMKELYKDFRQEFVQANRAINATGAKRGKIPELVVLNY